MIRYQFTSDWYHFYFHQIYTDFTAENKINHHKIQVKFDISNHLQNFCPVMSLFRLRFCWGVDIGFRSIILKVCRRIYHCKIQVRFDIGNGNHPQNFGQVMPLFRLFVVGVKYKVKILCPLNNFWRDALTLFEVCRMVYHYSIEVQFDFGNHPKNFELGLYLLD